MLLCWLLIVITDSIGSIIALTNVFEAIVDDRIVSVLPYLNQRIPPLSYVAVDLPYNLIGK